MVWKSPVQGTILVASYLDRDLMGKKVVLRGCAPSWQRLAPHLILPEGLLGTLTGIIELKTTEDELRDNLYSSSCTLYVQVCWDDIPHWHRDFCPHASTQEDFYRDHCLIDIFISCYAITPNFLFFMDEGKEGHCVQNKLSHLTIIYAFQSHDARSVLTTVSTHQPLCL